MAKQISVSTGGEKIPITFPAAFPKRKRNGTIRMCFLYLKDQSCQQFICVKSIISALQYKGAESQCIAVLNTGKDFFRHQPVTYGVFVAFANTAIIAVIFTIIGNFD